MPEAPQSTPLAEDRAASATALLVIDMLSRWDFPDADTLLAQSVPIAPRIATLAARCRDAGVPVVFANDNHGRWRSDLRQVVDEALHADGPGAEIARQLQPQAQDYFVLKPKHSGFHATPLDLLLRHLGVRRVILSGVSSDQCVLATAVDAKMHDYAVVIASDCVATQTAERNALALRHFRDVLAVQTAEASELPPTHPPPAPQKGSL